MTTSDLLKAIAAVSILTVFSCTKEPAQTEEQTSTRYTISVLAEKAEIGTRVLSLTGGTLNATWATTENIYVTDINPDFNGYSTISTTFAPRNSAWASSPLHPTASGASATLTGTFEGLSINQGDLLRLQFPKGGTMSYEGQKGTLEDISANYDYAVAYVNAAEIKDGNITPNGPAKFVNQQAIVKFKFLDKAGKPLNVSKLTITAGSGKLVQQKAYRDMTVLIPDYDLVPNEYSEGVAEEYKITNLFDGNLDFKWQSGPGQKINGAWVVRFGSKSEYQVDGYTFATCKDGGTEAPYYPNRNPKSWVVKASGNWIGYYPIASVSDDKVMRDESNKWYFYAVEKAARYNNFGFEISENQGDEFLQLGELCLLTFNHTTTYGPLTVTPASPASELTVALCNDYVNTLTGSIRDNYKLIATVGDDQYDYEKSEVAFEKGKYYEITIKMNKVASLFSVSKDKRVHFAPGNLYWSYGEWRMYANAWEYVGNTTNNTNPTATEGRIDLFCWGATGLNGVAPNTESSFLADNVNLAGNNDWGNVNLAYNPTGQTGWRMLSNDEWFYLINPRHNARSKMGFATITHPNGLATRGVVLLPDGWILPDGCSFTAAALPDNYKYSTNTYTEDQWVYMALAGAVFLPAAGQRSGTVVSGVDNPGNPYSDPYSGYYWTSTHSTYLDQGNPCAYYVWFSEAGGFNNTTGTEGYRYYEDRRSRGKSVRLVRDAE